MIKFNKPPLLGLEVNFVTDAISLGRLAGDNFYTKACHEWFEQYLDVKAVLLTTSCTHALEMAAILLDIQSGDEVIMPSYTFVSTANAFVLRGARVVFVDIRPDTMNIDETLIESAITPKTKAIIPVHYAGVGCDMDVIMDIANRHGLFVVEDAAQGMMSQYKGKPLGTIGHLGAFSFHETKNYTSGGEGGLLIINDERFKKRAEIIREKGTNRSQFIRGQVDKYSWVDVGSSYLPNELTASYLFGQLQHVDEINNDRLKSWNLYFKLLTELALDHRVELSQIPNNTIHNAHMFYLKVEDIAEQSVLIDYLKEHGVAAVFHYVPLHSSVAGKKFGRFHGADVYTTKESERLIRLPMYFGLAEKDIRYIVKLIAQFFGK